MIARFRKLVGQDAGSATVELALVAPIFATMLIGVVDITTAFNRKLELEQAVQRSIERVMQTTAEATVEANIKEEAALAAGIPESDVTVKYFLGCNGGALTEYDPDDSTEDDCSAGQVEVRYLTVAATATFTPMLPLSKLGIAKSHFELKTETGIRTQ